MKKRVKGTWPFEQRSTRNCIFCKTCIVDGAAKAYCSQGKHLAKYKRKGDKLYSISLLKVLSYATWVSGACQNCSLFEHDIPVRADLESA